MRFLVLNGSPKGKNSITLQTVLYWQKLFPEHLFDILHVGASIKALEKDFSAADELIQRADAFIFSYPVYTFIAPSQLQRFIRLMKEKQLDVRGKFMTQITTSKHFYDVTAHRYIEQNCQDMGMKIVHGLSADMDDLPTEKGQRDAESFFDWFLWCMEQDIHEAEAAQPASFIPKPVSPLP